MKTIKRIFILACLLTVSVYANLTNEKITLKPNMSIIYNKQVKSVDNLKDFFGEGEVYGRLRANTFFWDWGNNASVGSKDTEALGLGGSLLFKSAKLSGVSTTLGVYTAQNPSWFRENSADISAVKSGKDTFSRYKVASGGGFGMTVLAQAYMQYERDDTELRVGRQLFESVFTKSNDTKMIPNAFDGFAIQNKSLDDTVLRFAYFTKQKLRDHTTSHDVIAFAGGSSPDKWSQNDDAGVNRNLTVARVGDDNKLIIAALSNTSLENLKLDVNYLLVPDVLSNLTLEGHYAIGLSSGWKLVPGARYMQQFDHLNANYNVANLLTNHDGYKDGSKESLDTNLLALRTDLKNQAFLARLGYSQIADKADIVAPWRGFPTAGFTRAMAQYNWFANTKTYMARVGYDFDKAGVVNGLNVFVRYAIQDFDDKKAGTLPDSNVVHLDLMQNINENMQFKFRMGMVDAKDSIRDINGDLKDDLSYNEYRFELNYFF